MIHAALFFSHDPKRVFHKLPNHTLDVAAMIADFRVLRSVNFNKRGARKSRKATRHLGFPNASGTNHHNVLRANPAAHRFVDSLSTPAITNRDGYRPLRFSLTDNMLVKLFYDLSWGQLRHDNSSTIMFEFVYTSISDAIFSDSATISRAVRLE